MITKKGFTLQETLITLGIIGIVAALTIPSMVKLKPNETKTKYLKAYNSIANVTDDILNDDALYWPTYFTEGDDEGKPNCNGLSCTGTPVEGSIPDALRNSITPATKYARLVASRMHLAGDISCDGAICTFTTTDGIEWTIGVTEQPEWSGWVGINTDITNKASRACVYSNDCTNPARFTFNVSEDGDVSATDILGQAYLKNPTEIHDKAADLEEATKILKGTGSGSTGSGSTGSGS